ncbi:YojF family protein [Pseudalkalibacillus caeni]|uniref:DUF1806 family protein n=1 Tax=Exobacillus caeni TaxID=2574798 RepID=A0A5R9F4N8_9BACL|nr:YojF family protein [Pseudalkalibacillus caeni]TLS35454.1 DUF1806 family protein [Pseudalkalibacillus caeni]
MKQINSREVQEVLEGFTGKEVFLHLETTNGAYAAQDKEKRAVGAYIRNAKITILNAMIKGNGPFRIGLKTNDGWVYAEGLTDWEVDVKDRLLIAGHDAEGKLAVALQISITPFK